MSSVTALTEGDVGSEVGFPSHAPLPSAHLFWDAVKRKC